MDNTKFIIETVNCVNAWTFPFFADKNKVSLRTDTHKAIISIESVCTNKTAEEHATPDVFIGTLWGDTPFEEKSEFPYTEEGLTQLKAQLLDKFTTSLSAQAEETPQGEK
jgi:hypothetical protein